MTSIDAVCAARHAVVDTIDSLADAEFDHGATLCAGWSPRDVLTHLLGTPSEVGRYLRAPWRLHRINAEAVPGHLANFASALVIHRRNWPVSPPVVGPGVTDPV